MNDPRILGPIPTPPAQRWREIRLLYVPRVVFAVGVIVAAWMWNRWVTPATLIAEAEAPHAEVRTSAAGTLTALKVAILQPVKAGEVVALVAHVSPQVAEATLAVVRAELQEMAATMAGATDRQRVALEFERLQIDWMMRRVELADLNGKLQQTEADLARAEALFKQGLVTEQSIAQLRVARDSLVAQLTEQTRLVNHLEPIVRSHAPKDEKDSSLAPQSALSAAIGVAEAKLKLAEAQSLPQPLIAPIDGVVSVVSRRPGENLATGDSIVRIASTKPERLVGFLRQPIAMDIKPGMPAQIRSRGQGRQLAQTTVAGVGPAMEPISLSMQAALRLPTNVAPESGLRVHVVLPAGFQVKPGEIVDVVLQ
ncbi:MAG: HlyD family efflux transporter periplasmic adaptor subunit [Verrucomicrobia bacterium]|nr:HlyD family efflux transporter periplasmic adaptor subunit [Verrucomicrobiota bacterium]